MFNKYLSAKWTCKIICVNVFFSVKIQNEYVKYKCIVFNICMDFEITVLYCFYSCFMCLYKYKIVNYIFN